MDPRERLRQAFELVASHPRRTIASSLAVLLGAFALVLLLALGEGVRAYLRLQLDRYGRPAVLVMPGVTSSGFPGYRAGVRVRLDRDALARAERDHTDQIAALLPIHASTTRVAVEAGRHIRRLDLDGADERFWNHRNFRVGHGRFFDADDVRQARAVAVLGAEAAAELFGSAEAAVGATLRISGRPFLLLGVADTKGSQRVNANRPDDRLVVIPVTSAERWLGFDRRDVAGLHLYPRPGVSGDAAVRAVLATIGERAGIHPDDVESLHRFDLSQTLAGVDAVYGLFVSFIALTGTVTLVVGGIGIANYHLAEIAERSIELAIARAVGARSGTLVRQAILESVLLSGGASLAGAGLSLALCLGLGSVAPAGAAPVPVVSMPALAVALAAMLATSAAAALAPALRVRSLDVAAALRTQG